MLQQDLKSTNQPTNQPTVLRLVDGHTPKKLFLHLTTIYVSLPTPNFMYMVHIIHHDLQ